MKNLFRALTVFYILFPLFVVPLMQSGFTQSPFGSWFYLFGIVLYYLSILLIVTKQHILLMIPVLLFCWFWYTCGFNLHDFTFLLFICMILGAVFYQLAQHVKYLVRRVLPENQEAQEYDLKIEKMHAQLILYKQKHPTVNITPDIIDKVRNEIFFV